MKPGADDSARRVGWLVRRARDAAGLTRDTSRILDVANPDALESSSSVQVISQGR
jgi:hypothetical protein